MSTPVPVPFSAAHKSYVKSLYKRFLVNELNWTIRRDIWRGKALAIRAEFDRNRCVAPRPPVRRPCAHVGGPAWRWWCVDRDVHDPRALADLFDKAEADLAKRLHPDPYRRELLVLPGVMFL